MLVLIDRDGVLNEDRPDHVKTPGELVMIPGAGAAISRLNRARHRVVVVSNQSVVGRGIIGEDMLERIHVRLRDELARAGGHIDALIHCSDPPWAASQRRKPGAGMLREAMTLYRQAPEDTVMIGDSLTDLQAAASVRVGRILVRTGKGAATQARGLPADLMPVSVYDNLAAAVAALVHEAGEGTADGGDDSGPDTVPQRP